MPLPLGTHQSLTVLRLATGSRKASGESLATNLPIYAGTAPPPAPHWFRHTSIRVDIAHNA